MFKKCFFFIVLLFLFSSVHSYAQNDFDSTEIKSSVPELYAFHDVIYIIWHEAYPNKDIDKLKGLVPDIKSWMEKINNAKLPGILRDKETKWKEGLVLFNKSADNYYAAAEENDTQKLLDAAEELHAKFEMMVRIIKPVIKEVDEYHKILYVIYHKYLPEKKYQDIKSVMDNLVSKAEAIVNATLPKRLESKKDIFDKNANDLLESTKSLKEILKTSSNTADYDKAIEKTHTAYQLLESVFD